jgi:hypothetical protein
MRKTLCMAALLAFISCAFGKTSKPQPRIVDLTDISGRVTTVEVAPRFVTAIRVPEAVTSVAVGDPALFQVEHSDHEPKLVFVKVLTTNLASTNVLISTAKGHQLSLLVVSKGDAADAPVDFLVKYQPERSFVIEPDSPSSSIAETVALAGPQGENPAASNSASQTVVSASLDPVPSAVPYRQGRLDNLLKQQEVAPLPTLYGEHPQNEAGGGEKIRAGVGEVIDDGQDVVALFSVVNPQRHSILLMPPQVQLGGKTKHGMLIEHTKWTTAEQLPVIEYVMSKRRLGPGERADGVVLFERPPYKQSNETLFLQMAEAGAVDHPALAPIGFGISTSQEENHDR